jgi:4'-phosphopantetheinyl transferase
MNCRFALPPQGTVHLWLYSLTVSPGRIEILHGHLSGEECSRADRMRIAACRDRFVAARGQLREVLAAYLTSPPDSLEFTYGPHGKPSLAGEAEAKLCFNLSHSGDLALLAINREYPIGVDIERVKPGRPYQRLSERFFSGQESSMLCSLPPEEQETAFYACWTRKEAYLKAIGTGLATPLNAFSVSLLPGDPPALISQSLDPSETGRWDIAEIHVPGGYRAALATLFKEPAVVIREWPIAHAGYNRG